MPSSPNNPYRHYKAAANRRPYKTWRRLISCPPNRANLTCSLWESPPLLCSHQQGSALVRLWLIFFSETGFHCVVLAIQEGGLSTNLASQRSTCLTSKPTVRANPGAAEAISKATFTVADPIPEPRPQWYLCPYNTHRDVRHHFFCLVLSWFKIRGRAGRWFRALAAPGED